MGVVVAFRGRSYHRSQGCLKGGDCMDDYGRGCVWCEGRLFTCAVCGASEGALATDCPQRQTTPEEDDDVYAGLLDYVLAAGGWVRPTTSLPPALRRPAITCEEA